MFTCGRVVGIKVEGVCEIMLTNVYKCVVGHRLFIRKVGAADQDRGKLQGNRYKVVGWRRQ